MAGTIGGTAGEWADAFIKVFLSKIVKIEGNMEFCDIFGDFFFSSDNQNLLNLQQDIFFSDLGLLLLSKTNSK